MLSFKEVNVEELQSQWNEIFPQYVKKVEQLAGVLKEYESLRSKLLIIRSELELRNINVDDIPER